MQLLILKQTNASVKQKQDKMYVIMLATMAEAGIGGMVVQFEPSDQYSVLFCHHATDGQSDRMASDVEVHVKQMSLNSTTQKKLC